MDEDYYSDDYLNESMVYDIYDSEYYGDYYEGESGDEDEDIVTDLDEINAAIESVNGKSHDRPTATGDLYVKINGVNYFYNQSDFSKLNLSRRDEVVKKGIYVEGEVKNQDGSVEYRKFILSLNNSLDFEGRHRMDWDDAESYKGSLPSKAEAQIIYDNIRQINAALEFFGGDQITSYNGYCWINEPYLAFDNTTPCRSVGQYGKCNVRRITRL